MMALGAGNICAGAVNDMAFFAIKNGSDVGLLCRHVTDIFMSSNEWTLAIRIARRVPCIAFIKT
jgi:hypothetical protein